MNMETERLILRPWREDDSEALYKCASDPEVGPRAGWPPHKSMEESLMAIKTYFLNENTWAVVLKETGEIIGCAGYHPSSRSNISIAEDEAEVGYWIAKPYWNQGICTEALHEIVKYCFQTKCYNALWGMRFVDNPASSKVMEKCGFKDTGKCTQCEKLLVGGDKEVRILHLNRKDYKAEK